MALDNSLVQQQTLKQQQVLSNRQLQSLEVLQLPILELQEKLHTELERNPLLEDGGERLLELAGDVSTPEPISQGEREAALAALDRGEDGEIDYNLLPDILGYDHFAPEETHDADRQERREYFLNNLSAETSLQEQLLDELKFAEVTPALRRVAELVIGSIDDSGYLRTPEADLVMAGDVPIETVEEAVRLIQSFDPPGIGAHDLRECLMLQLQRMGEADQRMYRLLDYLEEIGANKLPAVARSLGCTVPELNELLDKLKMLNPSPGDCLTAPSIDFVAPECEIIPEGTTFRIKDNDDHLPRPVLSEKYLEMLESPDTPPDAKRYLREKLTEAKELLRALEQRQSTLHAIAQVICDTQQDFLREGTGALHPLTMSQAAERIERHETTVSRAIAGKFIKTPQGLFEFKFFFTGGYRSESGEDISSRAVKEKIKALIENESPAEPLSDDAIAGMLKDQSLKVSRRTVAKYRESMQIPTSYLRRVHR